VSEPLHYTDLHRRSTCVLSNHGYTVHMYTAVLITGVRILLQAEST